jgi:hypothetical protein
MNVEEMDSSSRRSFRDLHGRKAPRALWEILPQSVPYGMNIDPTNLCNFRCPFCPTGNPAALARVARPKGVMKLEVFQKILDTGLSEAQKARFAADFAPISDSWNIDSISGWSRMQIQDFTLGIQPATGVDGMTPKRDRLVCPEPFAKLSVNFDGSTSVCYADWSHGTVVGDVTRESVSEIWNGERLASFRVCHLSGQRASIPACSCCDYLCSFPSFADLDEHRDKLLEIFRPDASQRGKAPVS